MTVAIATGNFLFAVRLGKYTFDDHTISSHRINRFRVFGPLAVAMAAVRGPLDLAIYMHDDVNGITDESKLVECVLEHLALTDS